MIRRHDSRDNTLLVQSSVTSTPEQRRPGIQDVEAQGVQGVQGRGPGRPHAVHWDDVLSSATVYAQQGVDANVLVQLIRESNLRSEGETGFVLSQVVSAEVLDTLTAEHRSWYDQQIVEMTRVLEEAQKNVQKRIASLKARGGYTSSDIQRIKTSEYPKWSARYKTADKALVGLVAKGGKGAVATEQAGAFARIRAKTAGVDLGDLSEQDVAQLKLASGADVLRQAADLGLSSGQLAAAIGGARGKTLGTLLELEPYKIEAEDVPEGVPEVILRATPEELHRIEEAATSGVCVGAMRAYYTIQTCRAVLRDGSFIYVEALSVADAEQKAKDAGYDVVWTTWMSARPYDEWKGATASEPPEDAGPLASTEDLPVTPETTYRAEPLPIPPDTEYDILQVVGAAQRGEVPMDDLKRVFGADVVEATLQGWNALSPEYQEVVMAQGTDVLRQTMQASMPSEYQEIAEADGLEVAIAAYSNALEASETAQQTIQDFAMERGLASDDLVSLYYAGVGVDTLRQAYPGNSEYFGNLERVLDAIVSTVEVKETPGTFWTVEGAPTPVTHAPDYVGAVALGLVTVDDIGLLGYDSQVCTGIGNAVSGIQTIVAKFDAGVQLTPHPYPLGSGTYEATNLTRAEMTDLTTAFREAGVPFFDASSEVSEIEQAAQAWREELTSEDKIRVARVLVSYPALGRPLVSLHRALSTPTAGEATMSRIANSLLAAPVSAVMTPFVKDMTAGELREQLGPYATIGAEDKETSFDITKFLEDNPYDAPLLLRGGFAPEEVERAQEGEQVNTMPQGATPLDWVIMGAVVASFALPGLRHGMMAVLGTKGPLHFVTAGHFYRSAAATVLYQSLAIGETALKWGFPVGLTAADLIYWKDWTIEQKAIAGIFTGLAWLPVVGTLFRTARTGTQYARAALSRGPTVPGRALTTGYYDLYPIQVPRSFFADLPLEVRVQIRTIVTSNMAPEAQIKAISELLEPTQTAPAFLEVMGLRSLTSYDVPAQFHGSASAAFESVPGMTPAKAQALLVYLNRNPDVTVGGSVSMVANGFRGIEPHDLDMVVAGDDARVAQVRRDLDGILGSGVSRDVKRLGQYAPPPYSLAADIPLPVVIDGVRFVPAGELVGNLLSTVASPGLEGWMGPGAETLPRSDFPEVRVGTHEGRVPDYYKLKTLASQIATQLESQGHTAEAQAVTAHLQAYEDWLRTFETEGLETLPPSEAAQLRADVLALVRDAQYQLLEQGKGVVVLDPKGRWVVAVAASPANEVMPGAVIMATGDIRPNIEMANTLGKFKPTDQMVFLSPKAAMTYARGEAPGLNIILTVPSVDIGPGGIVKGLFRYETVEQAFGGEMQVIYDELTTSEEFLPTPKTALSYELGVDTGVINILDSTTGRTIPALVWRTPAAAAKGLAAPSKAIALTMTHVALKSALRGLLKPHMHDITLSEVPEAVRTGLFWFGDKPYDLRLATVDDLQGVASVEVQRALTQAVEALQREGTALTERNILSKAQDILSTEVDAASVPTMITQGMQTRLKTLGHSDAAIAKMTPQNAWDVLNAEGEPFVPSPPETESVVESVRDLVSGLDTRSRALVVREATTAYSEAMRAVIDEWQRGVTSLPDARKRLYYLNLGLLSLRLAETALATSLLTARTGAGSTLFLPTTSLTGTSIGVTSEVESILFGTTSGVSGPETLVAEVTSPLTVPTLSTTPIGTDVTTSLPTLPTTSPTVPPTSLVTGGTVPGTPVLTPPPTLPKGRPPVTRGATEQLRKAYEQGEPILLWRQGELSNKDVWKAVLDPENQKNLLTVVGTEKLPVEPAKYATGPGSARATLQWIGTGPKFAGSADLGIVDVFWGVEGTNLRFKGKGLETIVGERIDSPTIGISIPEKGQRKFGTTFAEALAYEPVDEAQRDFIEQQIQKMLPNMSSEEIAREMKAVNLPEERAGEILSYIPDQQRNVVRALLKPKYYTKVGSGFEFAKTSARPASSELVAQVFNGEIVDEPMGPEEEKALYSESELAQLRSEALSKVKSTLPLSEEQEVAAMLLEVKGL